MSILFGVIAILDKRLLLSSRAILTWCYCNFPFFQRFGYDRSSVVQTERRIVALPWIDEMGRGKASRLLAKRQRIEHEVLNGDGGTHSSADCYDHVVDKYVLDSGAVSRGMETMTMTTTRTTSSWLSSPMWMKDHDRQNQEMTVTRDDDEDQQEEDEEDGNGLMSSTRRRAEIESLSQQLVQVKRRLLPAANLCVESSYRFCCHDTSTSSRGVFNEARSHCNPYEMLGERRNGGLGRLFMNRAAIKLANIDALLNFELTHYDGMGPFVFVDLCGAPGGFSEYVMRRCQRSHKLNSSSCGYGMSLIGTNEYGEGTPWKLKSNTSSFENDGRRHHYRVCKGVDGTGDIFCWENVQALFHMMREDAAEFCHHHHDESSSTLTMGEDEQAKAHLVLADGGFDAQRDSEHQEAMAQKLVVCEVAAALNLLRVRGHLVVKMFGFQTLLVRTILADLTDRFEDIVALKPISSRPASAERYLVCRLFRGLGSEWKGGPDWCNQMLLGRYYTPKPQCDSYFDTFDRDMLRLNLKACFSILTYLENKQQHKQQESDSNYYGHYRGFRDGSSMVDIAKYKQAWQL